MKFQKFVKALGSDGIVYNRKNGERWLASDKVFMKIPEDIRSVTCTEVADMPEFVENIINYDSFTDPCDLHKAVMPYADGVIKDCVRIYATEGAQNKVAIDRRTMPHKNFMRCMKPIQKPVSLRNRLGSLRKSL